MRGLPWGRMFKQAWLWVLEPPWRHSGLEGDFVYHWLAWVIGWLWAVSGLVLGAFLAQPLLQWAGLANTQYADYLSIGVAFVAEFLVQFVGWFLLMTGAYFHRANVFRRYRRRYSRAIEIPDMQGLARDPTSRLVMATTISETWIELVSDRWLAWLLICGAALLPLASVGYGIYLDLTWVAAGQRSITVAFVGALLVKALLIPLIKAIVTGALFKWFVGWLRGDKVKKQA